MVGVVGCIDMSESPFGGASRPARQGLAEGASDPLASLLPRSVDVRVWVTRPHLAVVEFPMSQKSSVLMLEAEQGIYYRWQQVAMPEVRHGAVPMLA